MARPKKDIADMYELPFPVALRNLMKEKPATTQEKLAEVTGKTRQTISQYVNGISEPGYDTLVKIADYFDVSTDYLLGRTKDRRRRENIYDSIGLSEAGTTALRLAHAARQDAEKLNDFVEFLYGPRSTEQRESRLLASVESEHLYRASLLSKALPDLADFIISIATQQGSPGDIALHYADLAYPDYRPDGIDGIMSDEEYTRFKAYEIAEIIKEWILDSFYMSYNAMEL